MANLDPVKNFAIVTVSTGYDASATSIALTSGHGARLPAPSTDGAFNLVWWNSTDYSNPADDPNVEIVRVTARSTDTLTVTRAQESTSASTKNTSAKTYKMALVPTKKLRDDLTSAGVRVKTSSGTSFSTNTPVAISFNQEDFDTDAYHDNTTNNQRLTVPTGKAGKYVITGNVSFGSSSATGRTLYIEKNGTTILVYIETNQGAHNGNVALNISTIADLAEGDYVQLKIVVNGTGTTDTVYTHFAMHRI